MNRYTIKPDLDPNDSYQKALKDFIQAYNSLQKLTPQQQQQLVKDLLGYDGFVKFCMLMNGRGI
ncbi:MAG: hypothetical protein NC485_00745 [Ruminococcus flavefaciens]|nr:hypothetical protein [Ruminococcus flavefaciens]MCM1061624.1 hypothetical protein [Eubacterium sp.]